MPNCNHCGKAIRSAVVTCDACQLERAESIVSRICDELCRWPRECADEDELHEHCDDCQIGIAIVNLSGGAHSIVEEMDNPRPRAAKQQ